MKLPCNPWSSPAVTIVKIFRYIAATMKAAFAAPRHRPGQPPVSLLPIRVNRRDRNSYPSIFFLTCFSPLSRINAASGHMIAPVNASD